MKELDKTKRYSLEGLSYDRFEIILNLTGSSVSSWYLKMFNRGGLKTMHYSKKHSEWMFGGSSEFDLYATYLFEEVPKYGDDVYAWDIERSTTKRKYLFFNGKSHLVCDIDDFERLENSLRAIHAIPFKNVELIKKPTTLKREDVAKSFNCENNFEIID